MNSSQKISNIKNNSNISSNILTESTDRLSFSERKNLKFLHYPIKPVNRTRNTTNIIIPKIYTNTNNNNDSEIKESNNFLYSFSKSKKISKTINDSNYLSNEFYSNTLNNSKIFNKIKQPFYKINPKRKESLIDFNESIRNIRLLKIDTYNGRNAINRIKERIQFKKDEDFQFNHEKNEERKLMNIFKNNLDTYVVYLKRKYTEESMINENLKNKKYRLTKEIMLTKIKLDKMIYTMEYDLEIKAFLLSVKECSIDFNNFSKESQLELLYDAYKLFKYKTNFYKKDNLNNIMLFKKWIIKMSKNLKTNESLKNTLYFNDILSSININNFSNIIKYINNDFIKNHKAKNIFESVDDFKRTFLNNQLHIRLSLDNMSQSDDKLKELKNDLVKELRNEDELIKEFNLVKDKYYLLLDKLNIAKTNFLNNSNDNKTYSKYKKNLPKISNKINDKINIIINRIFNYNSKDVKKIKFERTNRYIITIFDKLKYIEKIMNYFIQYKKEQKYLHEKNYEIVMKEFKKEQYIRRFRNKEKAIKKLHELKIKKILDKKDKIYFLPYKK